LDLTGCFDLDLRFKRKEFKKRGVRLIAEEDAQDFMFPDMSNAGLRREQMREIAMEEAATRRAKRDA